MLDELSLRVYNLEKGVAMKNFTYYAPTEVIFGKGAENSVGKMLKKYGATKVLIHYGGGSVIKTGLLDRVKGAISQVGIDFVELGGVVPNPLLSKVYEGIELCRKEKVDFLLAVGGGSTIDSAKTIGMGLVYEGDVWDFFEGKETIGSVPVASILTLAAAGSEMSDSSVITKDEGMFKRSIGHPDACCKFSLLNPELTLTLPDYQTACGCVDILMHTMERYFNTSENLAITDEMAEGVMRTVIANAKILKNDPANLTARWNIMWAGSLSHNGLTGCATGGGDWSTHDIEHELGGMFDVAHGAGLAAIWGSWARYVVDVIPHRFAKYGEKVLGIVPLSTEKETALAAIVATEAFFTSIAMPISLAQLGVDSCDANLEEMAEKATSSDTTTVGSVIPLRKADMIQIFVNAR